MPWKRRVARAISALAKLKEPGCVLAVIVYIRSFIYPPIVAPKPNRNPYPDSTLIMIRHGESQLNYNRTFTGWVDADLNERGVREVEHAARLLLERGYEVDVTYTSRLKRAIRSSWILMTELHQIYRPVYKSWRLVIIRRSSGESLGRALVCFSKGTSGLSRALQWARSAETSFNYSPPLPTLTPQVERAHVRGAGGDEQAGARRGAGRGRRAVLPDGPDGAAPAHGAGPPALAPRREEVRGPGPGGDPRHRVAAGHHGAWVGACVGHTYTSPCRSNSTIHRHHHSHTQERTLPLWQTRILPDLQSGRTVMIVAHANSLRGIVKHIDNLTRDEIQSVAIPNGIPLVYRFDRNMRPIKQEGAVAPLSGEFLEKKVRYDERPARPLCMHERPPLW